MSCPACQALRRSGLPGWCCPSCREFEEENG